MANKIDQKNQYLGLRASVVAVVSGLALLAAPAVTQAAGLGKVVVQSALGQPLRAEIELTATRDELAEMKAQLATPDAFKQAGIDFATTLLGIRFAIDKRANGQAIIRLTSDRPINDPFVDMLLELNWPTGRLVREYTFLLDPPAAPVKAAPVVPATARPVGAEPAQVQATAPAPAKIDEDTRSRAAARVRVGEEAPAAARPAPARPADAAPTQETHQVQRGDTLNKIASATRPEGVTLDQMLVGLLRANQDAFDGGNMNRLKAGRILTIPDKSAIEAVSAGEARRIVVAQSSDWGAYRSKLAGIAAQAPGRESGAGQESAGKISAKVDDQTAAPERKDQLKVSPTEKATGKPGAGDRRGEEDLIAKEKALDDARQRVAALEKNVADLQKLVELKNLSLAELQKQAAAKDAAAVPATPAKLASEPAGEKPVETKASAEKAPESTSEKPAEKTAEAKAPESSPAPAAAQSEAAAPAEVAPPPKPAAPPKPKVKPVAPPPPPVEEPGLLDEVLDNPLLLAGGGGVLALLAALFVVRRRRASGGEAPLSLGNTLSQQFSSLTANSIFRSTGGQSVDTSHGPAQTDFSQAGPGSIDTDEVDPVAEADVYMAYGRDAQAEEILIEARQKDPVRHAIPLKLLEIYANRKDAKQFEALASELYSETGGAGSDWEKAAAIGQKLDPDNPLYNVVEAPVTVAPSPAELAEAAEESVATELPAIPAVPDLASLPPVAQFDQTISLPGELSQVAELASAQGGQAQSASAEPAFSAPELASLDFDLGAEDKPLAVPESALPEPVAPQFVMPQSVPTAPAALEVASDAPLDFDLGGEGATAGATASAPESDLGLDFELPELPTLEQSVPLAPAGSALGNEEPEALAGLDFDLDSADLPAPSAAPAAAPPALDAGLAPDAADGERVDDAALDFEVKLTDSTFLGRSMPEASAFDMSAIDLNLEAPAPPAPVAVSEEGASLPTLDDEASFAEQQLATVVNSAFDAEQQETQISPSLLDDRAMDVDGDAGAGPAAVDDDFEVLQGTTNVNPQFGDESIPPSDSEPVSSEDVTTKLDLAKAYEEMGDYEGARELLQEVLLEGDAAQRAKAQFILAKIGA